ncbi:MAG: metallophosphoesterase [Clostridia bacterium]|nr:metallophosphoesterase [Clostridia bacterium]
MKKCIVTSLFLALLFALSLISSPVSSLALEAGKLSTVPSLEDGTRYLLSMSGIKANGDTAFHDYMLVGEAVASQTGLKYADRITEGEISDLYLWTFSKVSDAEYTVKSVGAGKYLNLDAGNATLSDTPQNLILIWSGGKLQITTKVEGTTYYLRFTNTNSESRWHSGTGYQSSSFSVYTEVEPEKSYDNTGKTPLLTVACFSDLHVDYGIQSNPSPIRPSTVNAANYLKNQLGGADVILVGGDVVSNNDNKNWTQDKWTKTVNTVYSTLSSATKNNNGRVLMVSGNHETEVGVASGDTFHGGEYAPWMTQSVGAFKASLYFNDMGLGSSKFNELLCYRYTIGKMEFIGINTPYRPARSNGYLYPQQITWVENQLKAIGKDKTVVLLCHYPVTSIETPSGVSGDSKTMMTQLLAQYPNAIYCYGHVHGGDQYQVRLSTMELAVPQGSVNKLANNAYESNSWIHCHMGSMGHYKYTYQNNWLTAADSYVVQFMLISFYEDHITFQMYNTGAKAAANGVYEPVSFTVMRDLSAQFSQPDEPVSTNTSTGTSTDTDTTDKTSSSTKTSSKTNTNTTDTTTDKPSTTKTSTKTSSKTNSTSTDTTTDKPSTTKTSTKTSSKTNTNTTDTVTDKTSSGASTTDKNSTQGGCKTESAVSSTATVTDTEVSQTTASVTETQTDAVSTSTVTDSETSDTGTPSDSEPVTDSQTTDSSEGGSISLTESVSDTESEEESSLSSSPAAATPADGASLPLILVVGGVALLLIAVVLIFVLRKKK